MELLDKIAAALQEGDEEQSAALTREALAAGMGPEAVLGGLIGGMEVIGRRFRDHEIFLPDVLLASKAMIASLEIIRPLLEKTGAPSIGKAVIGTVQGDLHDIGKNLVGVMLKGAGLEVVDLGRDVSPEAFVAAAREHGAQVIGMSALLTTTMPVMREVVARVREAGLAGKVKTIIGGAPVSADYAREIGADAYAFDGADAVERVKALLAGLKESR